MTTLKAIKVEATVDVSCPAEGCDGELVLDLEGSVDTLGITGVMCGACGLEWSDDEHPQEIDEFALEICLICGEASPVALMDYKHGGWPNGIPTGPRACRQCWNRGAVK